MKETVFLSVGHHISSQPNINEKEGESNNEAVSAPEILSNSNSFNSDFNKPELCSEISFLTSSECNKIMTELKELLISVCDFSHDECAKLLTTLAKGKATKDKSLKGNDKSSTNGSISAFDSVSAKQIYKLSKIIENFTYECEKISSKSPTSLKGAFQYQANKFMNKFHNERKDKLSLILERETWSPAEVEPTFQIFLNDIVKNEMISKTIFESSITKKPELFLSINNEKYVIVG